MIVFRICFYDSLNKNALPVPCFNRFWGGGKKVARFRGPGPLISSAGARVSSLWPGAWGHGPKGLGPGASGRGPGAWRLALGGVARGLGPGVERRMGALAPISSV